MKRLLLVAVLLGLPACDRGPEPVPAEVQAAKREARRRACLSTELARAADEDLQTLEESFSIAGDDPAATLTRRTAQAAVQYAEVYRQHAQLRLVATARADSALNHSRTSADSLRHAAQAERFVISSPDPGTVEANVIVDFERKMAALLADEDHPCNWDLEER